MNKLKSLVEKGKRLLAEMDTLRGKAESEADADKRTEIEKSLSGKSAEFDQVKASIEAEKDSLKSKAMLAESEKLCEVPADGKTLTPGEAVDHGNEDREKGKIFYAYLGGKTLSDRERDAMKPKSAQFAEGADGVCVPDSLKCALMGKRWMRAMGKAIPMSSADALAAGGRMYLVPEEYRAELLELAPEPAMTLQKCTIVPTQTGTVDWPRLVQTDESENGGMAGTWIDEGGEKSSTEASFEQLQIKAYEYAAYTEITNRLLTKSVPSIEPIVSRLFRNTINGAIDFALLRGTGTGQPLGVINDTGVRFVGRATDNTIGYADLVNLEFALRANHRAGAEFVLQDQALRTLKLTTEGTTTSRPMFVASIANGLADRLIGYPYWGTHRLPTLGYTGDVVFGDWREYIVIMEEEIVVKRSEHYKFRNNVTAFTAHVVIGGRPGEPRAFAVLDAQVSTTSGAAMSSTTTGA